MHPSLITVLLLTGAACAPAPAAPAPAPGAGYPITIADARTAGPGATVLVEGVVTVPPGAFDGGFAIQDRTAGLWILPPSTGLPLALGQRVRVHGTLDLPNGQLSLHPAAIQPLGPRSVPPPLPLVTGEVRPAVEGMLVRVRGRVVAPPAEDAPWGWKVLLDDGSGAVAIFLDADTDVAPGAFRPGAELQVTGFLGRHEERLEILPRARGDVVPAPPR